MAGENNTAPSRRTRSAMRDAKLKRRMDIQIITLKTADLVGTRGTEIKTLTTKDTKAEERAQRDSHEIFARGQTFLHVPSVPPHLLEIFNFVLPLCPLWLSFFV